MDTTKFRSEDWSSLRMLSSTSTTPPTFPSTHFLHTSSLSNVNVPPISIEAQEATYTPSTFAGAQSSFRLPPSNDSFRLPRAGLPIDANRHLVYSACGPVPIESVSSLLHPPGFILPRSTVPNWCSNPPGPSKSGPARYNHRIHIPLSEAAPIFNASTLPNDIGELLPTESARMHQTTVITTLGHSSQPPLLGSLFSQMSDSGMSYPTMYELTTQTPRALSSDIEPQYEQGDSRGAAGESEIQSRDEELVNGTASYRTGLWRNQSKNPSRPSPLNKRGNSSGIGKGVPQEYKGDVERIFTEYLNWLCSDLDATDTSGNLIHHKLMQKKMQRLDQSTDFRPFKFRVKAFIDAFLRELARQGRPESTISAIQIKRFLWSHPYIARLNEEGNRAKSQGHHIWSINAKRTEGGWIFRPFVRKLTGTPSSQCVAYVGSQWTWTPRIWDPQLPHAAFLNVKYSSPALPQWLAWKCDSLTGNPPPETYNCDVTVEARFMQDGKEELLTNTVHITIDSMDGVNRDSALSEKIDSSLNDVPIAPPLVDSEPEQQVLTNSAPAVSWEMAGEMHEGANARSYALNAAVQQAVLEAAHKVTMDHLIAAGSSDLLSTAVMPTMPHITVAEVSVAIQSAVAEAMKIVGPLSSEVDILMAASSVLQDQTRTTHIPIDPTHVRVAEGSLR